MSTNIIKKKNFLFIILLLVILGYSIYNIIFNNKLIEGIKLMCGDKKDLNFRILDLLGVECLN